MEQDEQAASLARLEGKVAIEVLYLLEQADRFVAGSTGEQAVDVLDYMERELCGTIWTDHLVCIAAVLLLRSYPQPTVLSMLMILHQGFTVLYHVSVYESLNDWEPMVEVELLTACTDNANKRSRERFWWCYVISLMVVDLWHEQLAAKQQRIYRHFLLQRVDVHRLCALLK